MESQNGCDRSGKRDILEAFWGEDIPFYVQEKDALLTTNVITAFLESSADMEAIDQRLNEAPLYTYFTTLRKRLKMLASEEVLNKEQLYHFSHTLMSSTTNDEQIKLAILILGLFDTEEIRRAFKKLGLIGTFTLYVLEASRDFDKYNSFVFELAKQLQGYAKVAALHVLQPITYDLKKWMLFHGTRNEVMPNMSSIICLEKVDMADYLLNLTLDTENFASLSYLFAYSFEKSNAKSFAISLPLIQNYMESAPLQAKNFIDFSSILAIYSSMSPYWEMDMKDIQKENGWSSNLEQVVRSKCYNILHQKKWEFIVLDEMDAPTASNSMIIAAVKELQLMPPFEKFWTMLNTHPFDFDVFSFLVFENRSIYTKESICYVKTNIPEEVFQVRLDLEGKDLSPMYEPDMTLCFVLKAMLYEEIFDEAFFIRCLYCRLPDCRKEAIRCLRKFRSQWSNDVIPALDAACKSEPVKNIQKRYLRLLGKKDEQPVKEQLYIDISGDPVEPDAEDAFLFDTRVAGAFYRDLLAVDGVLEEGDLLYLVREPDNQYDGNAILVTTDDGYVLGYIPRQMNSMPAAMIDSGKRMYAILDSIHLSNSQLDISVFLSEADYLDDSGRPFLTLLKGGLADD